MRFRAVGEIGLDFYWSDGFRTEQTEALRRQIELCVISALAFSADAAQYTSGDMIQPYAATVTGSASSDDESEILSSQDWEALLLSLIHICKRYFRG